MRYRPRDGSHPAGTSVGSLSSPVSRCACASAGAALHLLTVSIFLVCKGNGCVSLRDSSLLHTVSTAPREGAKEEHGMLDGFGSAWEVVQSECVQRWVCTFRLARVCAEAAYHHVHGDLHAYAHRPPRCKTTAKVLGNFPSAQRHPLPTCFSSFIYNTCG